MIKPPTFCVNLRSFCAYLREKEAEAGIWVIGILADWRISVFACWESVFEKKLCVSAPLRENHLIPILSQRRKEVVEIENAKNPEITIKTLRFIKH